MMLACRDIEPLLAELAVGAGSADMRRTVEAHTATCAACAAALVDASQAWSELDAWQVPQPARAAVLEQVRADLAPRRSTHVLMMAVALGLGTSATGFGLLHVRVGLEACASSIACAGIWAAAFVLAFFTILSRRTQRAAHAAVWSSAALVALALICPAGELTGACVRAGVLGGEGVSSFTIGMLYGLIAAAVGLAATRRVRGNRSLFTVAAVAAFELPVLYLQCQPFATGALIAMLAGAVLASAIIGLADRGWARRTA